MAFNDCLMGEISEMIEGCHATVINDQKTQVVVVVNDLVAIPVQIG